MCNQEKNELLFTIVLQLIKTMEDILQEQLILNFFEDILFVKL
jgi:hypothetical protein